MSDRITVWSCGGGRQSAAIAALIIQGKLPKPDLSIIVDTGRERSSTWEYVDGVIAPNLLKANITLERVHKDRFATVDLYGHNGDLLLPAYTTQSGKTSKLPTYCSNEWKKRVMMRYLKSMGINKAIQWLGMSTNEMKRVRVSTVYWLQNYYPLIELGLNVKDCIELVMGMGWPLPKHSSCWMCPNMSNVEWKDMREGWPEDYEKALGLEKELQKRDEDVFLRKPEDGDISREPNGCDSGYCFV